jgi:NAD(P)H-dependent FMN reductase
MRILGISGSLRRQSYNTSLLRAAAEVAPEGVDFRQATLHGIPLYNFDEEVENGIPETVAALKEEIVASDGVLLITPEYNNSLPGVFKNAIDWCSRPDSDIGHVFGRRPFAVIGASPGGFGTILSQSAWLPVLRTLGTRTWFGPKLYVSRAGNVFDADGKLVDDGVRKALTAFLTGFAEFIGER